MIARRIAPKLDLVAARLTISADYLGKYRCFLSLHYHPILKKNWALCWGQRCGLMSRTVPRGQAWDNFGAVRGDRTTERISASAANSARVGTDVT